MGDHIGSYPLSSDKQGTLFQRNPVCTLCLRVCGRFSRERGGMHFDIIRCLEEADSLCEDILLNPWQIKGVNEYYHRLDERLNGSSIAVSCTVSIICVTFDCIEELPDHLRQLAEDLLTLITDAGYEIYESLSSAACRESVSLSAATYGLPPPKPDSLIQLELLRQENTRLTNHNKQLEKTIKSMKQEQQTRVAPIIKVAGDYIDIHDNHNCNIYATDKPSSISPESDSVPSSSASDVSSKEAVPRGRRIQFLFTNEYGLEDTEQTRQEAARVKQYVADHHWGQMRLDSKSTNRLNLMVACFWYYWHDRNLVPDIPQGAAIYRFVTEQCNLSCDVLPRAFMSAITRLINDNRKDPETYANLRTYFPK